MESGQSDELIYLARFLSISTECEHLDGGIARPGIECDGMDQKLPWSEGQCLTCAETRRKPVKTALKRGGSERMSQATEIEFIILMSNAPLTVGEYVKLIFILLR